MTKPTALRIAQGTAHRNKHRQNNDAPIPVRGIGEPPQHLNKKEAAAWDEIVGITYAGTMGEGDRIALEMLVKLLLILRENFEEMSAQQMVRLHALLSGFGLTPADRNKVRVIQKGERLNKFTQF
jgi:hypothetical protein